MENKDKMVLSDQQIGKEYQIPELVDLNVIGEAIGSPAPACSNGTNPAGNCTGGSSAG
jgi:hypothetical protein